MGFVINPSPSKEQTGRQGRREGDRAEEQRRRGPGKRRTGGKEDKEEGGTYQSAGHRGLVILGKMLLQGQDDAVGNDGGQDHVLEWREEGGVKEQTPQRERDTASWRAVPINTQTLSAPAASARSA